MILKNTISTDVNFNVYNKSSNNTDGDRNTNYRSILYEYSKIIMVLTNYEL